MYFGSVMNNKRLTKNLKPLGTSTDRNLFVLWTNFGNMLNEPNDERIKVIGIWF